MAQVFAFKSGKKVSEDKEHRFVMHTDEPTVHRDNRMRMKPGPSSEGWVEQPVQHKNGVKEHIHDETGSSLFVTHAPTRAVARQRIEEAAAATNKKLSDDYHNTYK